MSDTPTPPATSLPDGWAVYLAPFATAVGKSVAEVTALLRPLIGEPGEQAIALLGDATMTPDIEIKALLNGTPSAVANLAIRSLRAAPPAAQTLPVSMLYGPSGLLAESPSEETWLSALRAGGVLKVSVTTVNSAIRAALAHRAGLFEIPEKLAARIEQFAEENEEAVGPDYFKLVKQLRRREYADIFQAIEGLDGNYVTEARKRQLYAQIDERLWPGLIDFHEVLKGWIENWNQSAASPAIIGNALTRLAGGGAGALPPGMMQQVPDTNILRDASDGFNDMLNKVFAGTRMPIASALGYEASQIIKALENPALPGYVGAASRDQMLKMLGINVSATYPRMEANLVRYVLSILKVKDIAPGTEEQQFFSELFTLGNQIPWDNLTTGSSGSSASRTSRRPI